MRYATSTSTAAKPKKPPAPTFSRNHRSGTLPERSRTTWVLDLSGSQEPTKNSPSEPEQPTNSSGSSLQSYLPLCFRYNDAREGGSNERRRFHGSTSCAYAGMERFPFNIYPSFCRMLFRTHCYQGIDAMLSLRSLRRNRLRCHHHCW